jgi:hypothetical protein
MLISSSLCSTTQILQYIFNWFADHTGRAVQDLNRLRPLEYCGRGFESHWKHECLCAFILRLCVGSGLATG